MTDTPNRTSDDDWLPPWSVTREAELHRYALQETQAPAGAPNYTMFMRELFTEIGRLRAENAVLKSSGGWRRDFKRRDGKDE